ncbi:MAG: hypothetical protein ACK5RL_12525 [Acidimicrobiales bacterium]
MSRPEAVPRRTGSPRRAAIGLGLVLAAVLSLAGCVSGSDEEAGPAVVSGEAGSNPLPVVDVTDVATGDPVDLASLLPADQPVLLWLWTSP